MIPGLTEIIAGVGKGAKEIIGSFKVDPAEKLKAEIETTKLISLAFDQVIDFEKERVIQGAKNVRADAHSDSWLQRSWRPILMLGFGFTVIAHYFGFTPETISVQEAEALMKVVQWGMGGFIAGRSAEKITDKLMTNPPWTRGQR